jgi:hypothetical protein
MRNHLIAICLFGLLVTSCADWDEGQSTLSPNKKWFVDLQTKSGTNGFARIRVYDTDVYPGLKTKPKASGTPTASFTVPIQFSARAVDLKWNSAGTVLRIEQSALNTKPPIYYSLDLNSFSFSKVDQ